MRLANYYLFSIALVANYKYYYNRLLNHFISFYHFHILFTNTHNFTKNLSINYYPPHSLKITKDLKSCIPISPICSHARLSYPNSN